jgi:hypothetical protein
MLSAVSLVTKTNLNQPIFLREYVASSEFALDCVELVPELASTLN